MTAQRIAIIGSGISGLTAAYLLSRQHKVTVFEANDTLGGHTNTVQVTTAGNTQQVDTGFIVCNDRNYPNFLRLMQQVEIELQPTEMSFSVSNRDLNLEYNGHNFNTLFAQRRNLLSPRFYCLLRDILRFNRACKDHITAGGESAITLAGFVERQRLGEIFRDNYLLPMVAAIWSCSLRQAGDFPLDFFLRFFINHGLLDLRDRPQWHVVKGGSSSYIAALTRAYADRIHLSTPVLSVSRRQEGIELSHGGQTAIFDQVIMACHSDQALALLDEPTSKEKQILGDLDYQNNDVTLHSDVSLMPRRRRAWASWNFMTTRGASGSLPVVTYCMNILQGISSDQTLLVTLNAADKIAPEKIMRQFKYSHPVYSMRSQRAQRRREEICGIDRIHYCGAYWYSGFHEDGLVSALDVCRRFGESL